MKLTRACLEDLRALVELEAECGLNYSDQVILSDFRRSFRETYGIDWATALKQANTYAGNWRRQR